MRGPTSLIAVSWQQQLDGSADTDRQELGYLGGFCFGAGHLYNDPAETDRHQSSFKDLSKHTY